MSIADAIFGPSWSAFIGLTCILFGGAGWMTGRALAETWRPLWHAAPYALLLGLGDRFLLFALAHGTLITPVGTIAHAILIWVAAAVSYRITQVGKMVDQYPWIYERAGLFGWRERERGA